MSAHKIRVGPQTKRGLRGSCVAEDAAAANPRSAITAAHRRPPDSVSFSRSSSRSFGKLKLASRNLDECATLGTGALAAGPTGPASTTSTIARTTSTGIAFFRSPRPRAGTLAASRVGRRVVASYGTATTARPIVGIVAPSSRTAGIGVSNGIVADAIATARSPSRSLVHPGPALVAPVGTGRLGPIAIVAALATTGATRRASQVATVATVAVEGLAAIGRAGVASVVALAGMATAIRPSVMARGRPVGTHPVAGPPSAAVATAASRNSSRGTGRNAGASLPCPP